MEYIRTDGASRDFLTLCSLLDAYLDRAAGGGEDRARHVPLHNLLTDIHDVFIAYGGGRPVRCAGFKAHSRETAEVKRVFVREDCRGRGIARGPMLALKRLAYERG